MASVQSEDRALDGANDLRPFLLNPDEREEGSVAFDRRAALAPHGVRSHAPPRARARATPCAPASCSTGT